jgi:hypothetical protein
MASLVDRMMRAAKFDATVYEEVEADTTALGQATLVVVLSSLAGGIGAIDEGGAGGLIGGAIGSLIGWYVWAFLTYYIGTRWLPEPTTQADTGQLLRTLGFASSPGLLRVLGVIPGVGPLVMFIVAPLWMLCTMVLAVRQALDYSGTGRAIVVCVIGFLVQIAVIFLIAMTFGLIVGSESALPEA